MNVPNFFVFLSPPLGTESQKCVAACSTGTVAKWSSTKSQKGVAECNAGPVNREVSEGKADV